MRITALSNTLALILLITPVPSKALDITRQSLEQGLTYANKEIPNTILFPAQNYASGKVRNDTIVSNNKNIWDTLKLILSRHHTNNITDASELISMDTTLEILKAADKKAYKRTVQILEETQPLDDRNITFLPINLTQINQQRFSEIMDFLESISSAEDFTSQVSFLPASHYYNRKEDVPLNTAIYLNNLSVFKDIFSYLSSEHFLDDIKTTEKGYDKIIIESKSGSEEYKDYDIEDLIYSKNNAIRIIHACNITISLLNLISTSGKSIDYNSAAYENASLTMKECKSASELSYQVTVSVPFMDNKLKLQTLQSRLSHLNQSLASTTS